jgi:hypothetical protein
MSYSEARIQALENELFNLRQELQKARLELDFFKRQAIRESIKNMKK